MLFQKIDQGKKEIVIQHRDAAPQFRFKGGCMMPGFEGGTTAEADFDSMKNGDDGSVTLALKKSDFIASGSLSITQKSGHIVVKSSYKAAKAHRLAEWAIAPKGSRTSWNYLINFRNRHHHLEPYKTVSLRGYDDGNFGAPGTNAMKDSSSCSYRGISPISENTYSHDWHFAPHPSALIFQAPRVNLVAGCLELPKGGFGIYFDCFQYEISRWSLDLGGDAHGQEVKAGELVESPSFVFALDYSEDIYHTARLYHDILEDFGLIPGKDKLPSERFWQMPFTCTWFDQQPQGGANVLYHETGGKLRKANNALCSQLIDEEIETLKRTGSPWGILCIDDGWQIERGDWEMEPTRMAGIRKRIDELHAMGIKVMLWWAPFDVFPEAKMRERKDLLCGGGKLNRHGMPLIDYSNPHVLESYVKPLVRQLFSSEPGCCDADGVKTDFVADKIHPDMPVYDPEWRGEERFMFNTYKLFRQEALKFKPDWTVQGCTAHPYFEQLTSFSRCFDNGSTDYRIMFERAKMVGAFQPYNPVNTTADSSGLDTEFILDEALSSGRPLEIGGVLGWGEKRFTKEELEMLDRHVRLFVERWAPKL